MRGSLSVHDTVCFNSIIDKQQRNPRSRDHNSGRLNSRFQTAGRYEDRKLHPKPEGRVQQRLHSHLKRPATSPTEKVAKENKMADTKPAPEGPKETRNYYELNPLMTAMVEDELKDLMISVWRNLPDDAPNEAEKWVLEKFKDAAGDDLRQTVGLNVTKRLLNVNNVLRVKVIIPGEVSSSDLLEFEKKYQIVDFKFVVRTTYTGRMRSWADYDTLISAKNLTCGNSKVTVSPVYRFLHCPPNLRTVFDGKHDFSHDKVLEKEAAKKINKAKESLKVIATADKVLAEAAKKEAAKDNKNIFKDKDVKPKIEGKPNESKTTFTVAAMKNVVTAKKDNAEIKVEKTVASKPGTVKKEIVKSNTNTPTKIETGKTVSNKPLQAKPVVNKQTPNNTPDKEVYKLNIKVEPASAAVITKPQPTKAENKTTTQTKSADEKPTPTKTTEIKQPEPSKTVNKQPEQAETTNKASQSTKQSQPLKTEVNKKQTSVKTLNKQPQPNSVNMETVKPKPTPTKTTNVKTIKQEPSKAVQKPKTNSAKSVTNPNVAKKVQAKSLSKTVVRTPQRAPVKTLVKKTTKVEAKPKKNDDFDELDDHDILAMLSSGIVLDECCGSDED